MVKRRGGCNEKKKGDKGKNKVTEASKKEKKKDKGK